MRLRLLISGDVMAKRARPRNGRPLHSSTQRQVTLGFGDYVSGRSTADMKLENHRLIGADGKPVAFVAAAHCGAEIDPKFIVMHYTAGGSATATVRYFASEAARASAHFVIGRKGEIVQQVACNRAAWHAGRSSWCGYDGLNRHSIGIELANWGRLGRGPEGYVSHSGAPVESAKVLLATHRHRPERIEPWEIFPEAQITAAAAVVGACLDSYGLAPAAVVGHDDVAPSRKIDPGPAFDMARFRGFVAGRMAEVAAEADFRRVTALSGLNLRAGPGLTFRPLALLAHDTRVRVVFDGEPWLFVSAQRDGRDGTTGYVHGAWLVPDGAG